MPDLEYRLTIGISLLLMALASFAEDATRKPDADAAMPGKPVVEYPVRREVDGMVLVVHPPQIRAWPEFERFEGVVAVEVSSPDDTTPRYASASLSGETDVDLGKRVVRIRAPQVDGVEFADPAPEVYRAAVMHAVVRSELEVPLDLFLAHLADDVLSVPPPQGFNTAPPPIVVRSKPTLLLSVNGEVVKADVEGTWLQLVVNANWPLFRTTGAKTTYYLLERDRWLESARLEKGWKPARSLPTDFTRLPDEPQYAAARAAVPLVERSRPVPQVLFATQPTELIVTDGKPRPEPVAGAGALEYVANTESLLFHLDGLWYYLVAGRWFSTGNLDKGPWRYVTELPEAFSLIPEDHPLAVARVSVPGTMEARIAALEAMLPTRVSAGRNDVPPIEVSYAGDPEFEAVAGTGVSRAVNTGFDVVSYEGRYYLLYSGIWYEGHAPTGPWAAAANIPAAIYRIPPSSPSYHVTQVTVVESTPTTVVYSYPAAYSTGVYVAYGVSYYGTGWYYPPYVYGPYYYPYMASYGYGAWYNPATGGYGARSVWYGPYGGYSYNQGYNPSSGRYGYVETAWDGDEWASYGETYNPRTGTSSATERYYDEDKNRSEMERTSRRGDEWVKTEREVDYDERTSSTQRETSRGGSSDITRSAADGTLTSSGSITTGSGSNYSVSGEATREGGSTTISGADGTANIDTRREDGRSVSTLEGSGGGQGVSMSGQGPGRTTVGQSGSGDLYAGHDGNVYKKTDSGWQHYQEGGWQQVDVPDRPEGAGQNRTGGVQGAQPWRADTATTGANRTSMSQSRQSSAYTSSRASSVNYSQLNRDYGARQYGTRQYQQRASGMVRGSGFSGGGRRR